MKCSNCNTPLASDHVTLLKAGVGRTPRQALCSPCQTAAWEPTPIEWTEDVALELGADGQTPELKEPKVRNPVSQDFLKAVNARSVQTCGCGSEAYPMQDEDGSRCVKCGKWMWMEVA